MMWKRLAIFAFAAIVIVGVSVPIIRAYQAQATGDKDKHAYQTGKHNHQETAKPDSGPPAVIDQQTINCEPSRRPDEHEAENGPANSHDWIDRLNASSTAVIAVFTIFLFAGVVLQVGTSRDTERSWVIASPEPRCPMLSFAPEVRDPIGKEFRNIFVCAVRNVGSTPARIIDATVAYRQVQSLGHIPVEPEYGQGPMNAMALVKEDSFAVVALLQPHVILSKKDYLAIEASEEFLYGYGRVIYKDVFGRTHETRFGYLYHFPQGGDPRPSGFQREGLPPAYNHAT